MPPSVKTESPFTWPIRSPSVSMRIVSPRDLFLETPVEPVAAPLPRRHRRLDLGGADDGLAGGGGAMIGLLR